MTYKEFYDENMFGLGFVTTLVILIKRVRETERWLVAKVADGRGARRWWWLLVAARQRRKGVVG